jgi:hypothetical protein
MKNSKRRNEKLACVSLKRKYSGNNRRCQQLRTEYDKQDQQGKAAFNERNPHTTQQQEPAARSSGGPKTKTGQDARESTIRLITKMLHMKKQQMRLIL